MSDIVKPRPISGFPEWLPEQKLVEEQMLDAIRGAFRRFGFTPIETPAVERKEVLAAKGVAAKEIYALSRLAAAEGEDPDTDLALHFDLTVPTARYVAQHFASLTFPFRRYQIQKVWRGERPQAGRFREFYQCDVDIIGNESLGLVSDAEVVQVIDAVFRELDIGRFLIRLNNRKLLHGLLEQAGLRAEAVPEAMRAVDALDKIGPDGARAELGRRAGLDSGAAARLIDRLSARPSLTELERLGGGERFAQGLAETREVLEAVRALGVPDESYVLDVSIARGLDYYTGTVVETVLADAPEIGAVCSGGRYDDLAGNYTRQRLPGVGVSIGLTRLLSRLFDAGLLAAKQKTPARVLVALMEPARLADYAAMATELRAAGIATELFTEPKKLKAQLRYADQKGFAVVVLAGEQELSAGTVQLKVLAAAEQSEHPRGALVAAVRERLG